MHSKVQFNLVVHGRVLVETLEIQLLGGPFFTLSGGPWKSILLSEHSYKTSRKGGKLTLTQLSHQQALGHQRGWRTIYPQSQLMLHWSVGEHHF